MYRQPAVANRICSTIEKYNNHMILVDHLSNIKPSIDNKQPKSFGILKKSKKMEQIILLKQNEIERENKHLIEKITQIMQNHQINNTPSNLQSNAFDQVRRSESQYQELQKKSLNSSYRKKELIKIVIENQSLLKRIQSQKSKYNCKHWERQRLETEKQIANISEYPYKDYNPHKTIISTNQQMTSSRIILKKIYLPKKLNPISTRYPVTKASEDSVQVKNQIFKHPFEQNQTKDQSEQTIKSEKLELDEEQHDNENQEEEEKIDEHQDHDQIVTNEKDINNDNQLQEEQIEQTKEMQIQTDDQENLIQQQ